MNFKDKKRSTERVTRRPEIVLALNNELTKIDRKEICGCNQTESGWRKEFNDLLNSLEEKETWLFKECEISLCRWWAGRWSEASHRSNLVPEGLLYIDKKKHLWKRRACSLHFERWTKAWFRQRRASNCSSWNWVTSWRNSWSLIWKKNWLKMNQHFHRSRESFKRIVQENRSRESFKRIIFAPSSELTRETLWGCEKFRLL